SISVKPRLGLDLMAAPFRSRTGAGITAARDARTTIAPIGARASEGKVTRTSCGGVGRAPICPSARGGAPSRIGGHGLGAAQTNTKTDFTFNKLNKFSR